MPIDADRGLGAFPVNPDELMTVAGRCVHEQPRRRRGKRNCSSTRWLLDRAAAAKLPRDLVPHIA